MRIVHVVDDPGGAAVTYDFDEIPLFRPRYDWPRDDRPLSGYVDTDALGVYHPISTNSRPPRPTTLNGEGTMKHTGVVTDVGDGRLVCRVGETDHADFVTSGSVGDACDVDVPDAENTSAPAADGASSEEVGEVGG